VIERTTITPFDDVESSQLEIGIRINANGAPDALVDE